MQVLTASEPCYSYLPPFPPYLTSCLNSRYDGGDVAFIILAGALVFLMVPGLGTFLSNFISEFLVDSLTRLFI